MFCEGTFSEGPSSDICNVPISNKGKRTDGFCGLLTTRIFLVSSTSWERKKKKKRELHHPVIDNFSMPHCVSAFLSDYDLIKEHWVIIMTNWMNRNKMNDIYILNSHYWLNNLVYLGFLTRLSLGFAGFFCFFKIFYTFPHATTC